MKIISLAAENIKKLKAIEIHPDGNMVVLSGKNGSGKTSALDSISWAFEGLAKVQKCPIRYGQNKAWIRIDLGKYIVERTFKRREDAEDDKEYTSSVTVIGADGVKVSSPQAVLDEIYGMLAFDPLAFSRAASKDQVTMLESMVKDFDFAKSRAEEKDIYDQRTVVNRNIKDTSLLHVSFKDVPVAEPPKVDVKALTDQMAEASQTNVAIEKEKAQREADTKKNITDKVETKNRLQKEYREFQEKSDKEFKQAEEAWTAAKLKHEEEAKTIQVNEKILASMSEEIEKANQDHKNLPPLAAPVDVAKIKAELDEATSKNELHERWTKKNKAKLELEELEAKSKDLTERIAAIQLQRVAAVANAGLPIAGLGFDENGVTLNGIPFSQASDAEQLRTSIAIAMAANPELRVVRVRDGSLLDPDGMKLLAEMAEKNDCQCWIERVGSGEVGFELVDGQLKQ